MQAKHFILAVLLSGALCALSQATQTGSQQQVSVSTSSGLLLGLRGQQVHKFLGVPYAKAPLGSLRFQRPEELPDQRQQLDATKHTKTCPQYRHLTRFISPLLNLDADHQTSEDCLHLSLYVPASIGPNQQQQLQLEPSRQLPVLVWLPGEGFDFADARQFDGSQLAHKTQSIVVVVQYRVGALGFLHAPQLNITGNMGLYDQVMALKWLRRNLQSFGGDPDRVTLMGRFSGSMSISALITAPRSQELLRHQDQPLFQRAALLSGIAVPKWIIDEHSQDRFANLMKEAREQNFCQPAENNSTCLSQIPVEQLMRISGYGWRPVRDNSLIGRKAPIEAAAANQINDNLEAVLLGETSQEGTLCLYRHLLEDPHTDYARQLQENQMTREQVEQVMDYDAKAYFGFETSSKLLMPQLSKSSNDTRQAYLEACSHYMIKGHADRFKRQLLARNRLPENRVSPLGKRPLEVYHYELRYKPSFSLAPDYIKEAAHGDDIPLIFGLIYNQPRNQHDQRDLLMTRKMMSYVGNFVHGNSPLLGKSSLIDTEIVSMDDQESPMADSSSVVKPSSFASEASLDVLDLSEAELDMNKTTRGKNFGGNDARQSNVRLILLEPQQQQQSLYDTSLVEIVGANEEAELGATKSRRLVELHRQQVFENNWYQLSRRPNLMQQQPLANPSATSHQNQNSPTPIMATSEGSFMTLFVFSSCTILFILMSICLGLCLLIARYNVTQRAQSVKFSQASVSSCNICDDSRQSIEAVLQAAQVHQKKDGREFGGNVFAKFQQQHQQNRLSAAAHSSAAHRSQLRCQPEEQQQAELRD